MHAHRIVIWPFRAPDAASTVDCARTEHAHTAVRISADCKLPEGQCIACSVQTANSRHLGRPKSCFLMFRLFLLCFFCGSSVFLLCRMLRAALVFFLSPCVTRASGSSNASRACIGIPRYTAPRAAAADIRIQSYVPLSCRRLDTAVLSGNVQLVHGVICGFG